MEKDKSEELTPGELFAMLVKRKPAVDSDKSPDELSIAELLVLESDSEELKRYLNKILDIFLDFTSR